MSRTANRPKGGKSEKASTHIGLDGSRRTMPASPDLMWAVWQSRTGEYPLQIWSGWFSTITCAVKSDTPQEGLFLESEAT